VSAVIVRLHWLAVAALLIAGCSELPYFEGMPNFDHGSAGCQNAVGIGPTNITEFEFDKPVVDGVVGKSPIEAAAVARTMGHTVVFNVQIPGYGECWCVPPPQGTVTTAWWGQHGALWLMVEGVSVGHTPDNQPARGWGC
jgi:hypothetical protein